MGIAMLWVIFYHTKINCSGAVGWVKKIGYGGVDIFIFASGIGNFYSYIRDCDPVAFLKRRIYRLAPVYIPFIVVWLIYKLINDLSYSKYIVGNLFAIQGFTRNGGEFNWYLTGILMCYLLTPYFAQFVNAHDRKKNWMLVMFLLLLSTAFWNDHGLIISITRLPIYVVGMITAKNEKKVLSNQTKVLLAIAFLSGNILLRVVYGAFNDYLWNYGLYWYPFILIIPCLCLLISYIISVIEEKKYALAICRPVLSFIALVGKCSFEAFLIHAFAFEILAAINQKYGLPHLGRFYIGVGLGSIVCAIAVNRVISQIQKAIRSRAS